MNTAILIIMISLSDGTQFNTSRQFDEGYLSLSYCQWVKADLIKVWTKRSDLDRLDIECIARYIEE